MNNRAALYCRISTSDKNQSNENQVIPLREFAKNRGFGIVSEFSDEGISGATERRKGLDAMLAEAKKGKFSVLIVMEISRLARDVRHLLNLLHELDRIGITVISLREGVEFNSVMGRAMVAMIGILVSVERELLRERIKSALYTKKLQAEKTGSAWRCGRPSVITPENTAKVLALRSQRTSLRQIAKQIGIAKSSVQRILAEAEKTGLKT